MRRFVMTDTALGLIARWIVDAMTSPTLPDERQAVGRLRFESAARLPPDERDELLRLLDPDSVTPPDSAGPVRQEGLSRWH